MSNLCQFSFERTEIFLMFLGLPIGKFDLKPIFLKITCPINEEDWDWRSHSIDSRNHDTHVFIYDIVYASNYAEIRCCTDSWCRLADRRFKYYGYPQFNVPSSQLQWVYDKSIVIMEGLRFYGKKEKFDYVTQIKMNELSGTVIASGLREKKES